MGSRDGFAQQRAIWSIRVGRRQRHDLGDIDQLKQSMHTLGLLQPITVDPDGVLICGARRLEAARQLGWKTIRVWVRENLSTPLQQLLAEQHENTMRKSFTPSEAAGIYEELKALYAEDAARRQHASRFGATSGVVNLATPTPARLEPRAQAALMVTGSLSYTTLERVAELQDLADNPATPEALREIARVALVAIDDGGKVYGHYRRVKQAQAALLQDPVDTPEEQSAVVRAFVDGLDRWREWARAYDPAEVAPALQPQQRDTLTQLLADLQTFADTTGSTRPG